MLELIKLFNLVNSFLSIYEYKTWLNMSCFFWSFLTVLKNSIEILSGLSIIMLVFFAEINALKLRADKY